MAGTKSEDMRLLSREERELVAQSRQPAVKKLSDQDLGAGEILALASRSRAGDERQTARPRFSNASLHNGGVRPKLTLLVAAAKRVNKELQRRIVANA